MLTRLLICGAYAALLGSGAADAGTQPPLTVQVMVLADGSFVVQGHRYATSSAIKTEIRSLNEQKPRPVLQIHFDKRARYDVVAKTLALFQQTGTTKIGIVNTWDDGK